MNERGFSYIEVLIASFILSILLVPLLYGFKQAMANYEYSKQQYKAIISSENLLLEVESKLLLMDNSEYLFNELSVYDNNLNDFIELTVDEFFYAVKIEQINSDEFYFFYNESDLVIPGQTEITTNENILFREDIAKDYAWDYIVKWDLYPEIKKASGETTDNSNITIDNSIIKPIEIKIDAIQIAEDSYLDIINLSDKNVYLHINKEDSTLEEKININYRGKNSTLITQYFNENYSEGLLVTVAVFNKNKRCVKKVVKII